MAVSLRFLNGFSQIHMIQKSDSILPESLEPAIANDDCRTYVMIPFVRPCFNVHCEVFADFLLMETTLYFSM